MIPKRFNIRVYGLFVNDEKEVLLSDEHRFGKTFTKFPGGGLEFGEGTLEGLQREAMEEMNQEIEGLEHFYTTDFCQPSVFNPEDQIISIYYLARLCNPTALKIKQVRYDFDELIEEAQEFRYQSIASMGDDDLNFPIDRVVLQKMKKEFI